MTKKQKGAQVVEILKQHYPDTCSSSLQKTMNCFLLPAYLRSAPMHALIR